MERWQYMGEKVYRPKTKEGHHLVRSKENPDCVRGVSFDENNKNIDIPEWEEVDVDDLPNNSSDGQQEAPVQEIWCKLALATICGATAWGKIIKPLWNNELHPWIKNKFKDKKKKVLNENQADSSEKKEEKICTTLQEELLKDDENISEQIDSVFKKIYLDLNEDEMREHMMRLIFHMLGTANEIRLLSNAQISKNDIPKEIQVEQEKEIEKFLASKVSDNLNEILSKESLYLDMETSKKIFDLTGGGVRRNDEYLPVEISKIEEVLKSVPLEEAQ